MANAVTNFEATAAVPRRHVGQGTLVEQSRAVAEVQAAVVVAQQRPRDTSRAMTAMREACEITYLAERAFFRYSRGGSQVTGPSVHLARELARCWGNIDYGHKELSRDDDRGQSEMLAFAWDLETNARSEVTFIVPHARDTKSGVKALTDMRDIYENNANNAARRLRECIFSVLPVWYTEDAKDRCRATLENGGGKPLAQRIADCIAVFDKLGVSRRQLEKKVGRSTDEWIAEDVATLGVVYKSIKAGETTRADEFERDDEPKPLAPEADAFERASAGAKTAAVAERHDPDAGEIAQDTAAPDPMPPSPLTAKKGAVDTAWLAWERAASQRIEAMPQPEIAGFLSEHSTVFDEMAKLRPASWQAIEALIERKKDAA